MSQRQAKRARRQARAQHAQREQQQSQKEDWQRHLNSLSHRRKWKWAQFHVDEADELIKMWAAGGGYRVFQESDTHGGSRLLAEQLEPLPDELSLIIGDALQCLRNGLDNLAFILSRTNTPVMPPSDEKNVSFPIMDRVPVVGDKQIKLMSPNAQADICDLCPDPERGPANQDPLWLLNKTANRDKHREIPLVVVSYGINNMTIGNGHISHMAVRHQQLHPGEGPKPILEFAAGTHVALRMSHGVKIGFGKGIEVEGREVIPTLRWFYEHIGNNVFQRLEAYLDAN